MKHGKLNDKLLLSEMVCLSDLSKTILRPFLAVGCIVFGSEIKVARGEKITLVLDGITAD